MSVRPKFSDRKNLGLNPLVSGQSFELTILQSGWSEGSKVSIPSYRGNPSNRSLSQWDIRSDESLNPLVSGQSFEHLSAATLSEADLCLNPLVSGQSFEL